MWVFLAPHPASEVVMILPSPEMGDSEQRKHQVQLKRTHNGTNKTHIQANNNRHFTWTFVLTRHKALEFKAWYTLYAGQPCKIITHENVEVVGNLVVNPLSLQLVGRGVIADSVEKIVLAIDFEATE